MPAGRRTRGYGRLKSLFVCLAITALVLVGMRHAQERNKSVSGVAPAWIVRRAVMLASLLGDSVQITEAPQRVQKHDWSVTCRADGMELYLTFDGSNGRLIHLGTRLHKDELRRMVAPLATAAEAQEVAQHHLCDLQVIPSDNRLKLLRPPCLSYTKQTWIVVWNVLPPNARPYRMDTQWDVRTGLPLKIVAEHTQP
jgi:hypothetical protein